MSVLSVAELSEPRPAGALSLGDPLVRAQLAGRVRRRPAHDPVHPALWQQVGFALAATSRAVDLAREGGAPGSTALLVAIALAEVQHARVPLELSSPHRVPSPRWSYDTEVRLPLPPADTVERTWSALAALLGPEPVLPQDLADALRRHGAALLAWQRVLRRAVLA